MLIWISIPAIIATMLFNTTQNGVFPGAWVLCFGSLLFLISVTGVFEFGYRCRKCGNKHLNTSMDNVLNYPENDQTVLDVPYETTIKFFSDDY
jgi:hypothetical protein